MKGFLPLLLAGIVLLSGCSRYATIAPEQLYRYPENNITGIKLPAKIIGIITKSADTIYFDSNGGFYYPKSIYKLTGTLSNGEEFVESIFFADQLIFESTHKGKILIHYMKPHRLAKIGKKWQINPDSTAIMEDIYFNFDKDGGRINFENNQIYRQIINNENTRINTSEISELTLDRLKIGEKRYLAGFNCGSGVSMVSGNSSIDIAEFKGDNKIQFGIGLTKKYSQRMSVLLEANLSIYKFNKYYKSSSAELTVELDEDISLETIEMAFLTKYMTPDLLNIKSSLYLGPFLGYVISSKNEYDSTYTLQAEFKYISYTISENASIPNIEKSFAGLIIGYELSHKIRALDIFLDVKYKLQLSRLFYDLNLNDRDILNIREKPLIDEAGNADRIKINQLAISLGLKFAL